MSSRRSAYEALLELERSQDPFSQQIVEAADIVGFDLRAATFRHTTKHNDEPGGTLTEVLAFSGKEEWVLRWLLKHLASQDNAARWNPQAWCLITHVLKSVPVDNAARHLKAHGFLDVLGNTLADGARQAQAAWYKDAVAPAANPRESVDPSDGSKSSSTVVPESVKHPPQRSKKRKRPGTIAERVEEGNDPQRDSSVFTELFLRLLETLDQTVWMAQTKHKPEQDNLAGQYMTAVLRTDPDHAARILGSSFRAGIHLISNNAWPDVSTATHAKSPLIPFVNVWDYRSVGANDLFGRAGNVRSNTPLKRKI